MNHCPLCGEAFLMEEDGIPDFVKRRWHAACARMALSLHPYGMREGWELFKRAPVHPKGVLIDNLCDYCDHVTDTGFLEMETNVWLCMNCFAGYMKEQHEGEDWAHTPRDPEPLKPETKEAFLTVIQKVPDEEKHRRERAQSMPEPYLEEQK